MADSTESNSTTESSTAEKKHAATSPPKQGDSRPVVLGTSTTGVKDGEFDGTVRYEGTVLVERKEGDDWIEVMTDRPRAGDRVPAKTANPETGELEQSTTSSTSDSPTPPRA